MNIVECIRQETGPLAHKLALVSPHRAVTYETLFHITGSLAATLRARGIRPTERVAVLAGDSIDYVALQLAILSISAVAVPLAPSLPREEVETALATLGVRYLITEKTAIASANGEPLSRDVLTDSQYTYAVLGTRPADPPGYDRLNPAFIRFSSGTTGINKGVLLSHETIDARTRAANRALRMSPDDVVLWLLPMSYHFVVSVLLFLRRGATLLLCERDFPETALELAVRHRVTFTYGAPFHYQALACHPLFPSHAFSAVRMAICTSMRLPRHTANAFLAKFGFPLSGAYGLIEVGLPFVNCSRDVQHLCSVGQILPDYQVRLPDTDADGVGRIQVRGPGLLDAYFSPWQPREQILQEGWFDTGDLGRLTPDGFLEIVGRTKDVINFLGMKIFPEEVEDVLCRHPAVEECVVCGDPHPDYGQLPVAKLVLNPRAGGNPDLNELRRFCYQHLAAYKVPKHFVFVDHISKTASGKLRRT